MKSKGKCNHGKASSRRGGKQYRLGTERSFPEGLDSGKPDFSFRFVKDSLTQSAWWALGTRAGGEVLSGDQY